METLRDLDIVRGLASPARAAELRADGEGDSLADMVVRFSPYGTWYEIDSWWEGRFLERTERGAFAKTIAESRQNVKVQYDHGYDPQIGGKILGEITDLTEDEDSARGDVALFDTSYNRDLLPGLRAGVYGSSFRFRVIRDEWNDEPGKSSSNPDGIPERTIKEVRLFEFGPVTFPANPDATAGVRCLTDSFYARLAQRDPDRVDALRSRVLPLRTSARADAASNLDPAPTEQVTRGLSPRERRHLLFPILTTAREQTQ